MEFGKFGISTKILSALSDMGFASPTPIQEQSIPLLLQGEDIIGQAQTGTGKTAAFGIFMLERFLEKSAGTHPSHRRPVMALILTPTRELCMQVKEEIASIGKYSSAKIIAIYGGQEIGKQLAPLSSGVDIVVGTPGRVIDHIERGSLDLSQAGIVVLDEADRMLDMGFIDDVELILQKTPPSRQTMLFSATMPEPILHLSKKYMRAPQYLKVSEDSLTVKNVVQKYAIVDKQSRLRALIAYLRIENTPLAIIFARTKLGADRLNGILLDRGFKSMALHGDLSQNRRDHVMHGFREGHFHILVATDLAARGLDVDNITHVINYDIPQEPFTYVHRVGRTGRMGKPGKALTLIFPDQENELIMMQKAAQTTIDKIEIDLSQSGPAPPPHVLHRDGEEGGRFGRSRGSGGHRREGSGYSGGSGGYGSHSGGSGSYRGSHEGGSSPSGTGQRSGGYGSQEGRFGDRRGGSRKFGDRGGSGRDDRRRRPPREHQSNRSSRGSGSYTGRTR
jgi:ATP-dependent RNA helicase DeaD